MFKRVSENWGLKLVSLAFALVLWFFVIGERNYEVGYTVPLELKNVPEGMLVASDVPGTVDVRLSGPRSILLNLGIKDVGIIVDLAGLQAGVTTFRRLEERLNLPTGIRATRISPAYIDIKLEQLQETSASVRPLLAGRPAAGYVVAGVEISPEQVMLSGAASELLHLREVPTERIEIDGLSNSFQLSVPINYRGRYSRLKDRQTVEVYVRIEPAPSRKETTKSRTRGSQR